MRRALLSKLPLLFALTIGSAAAQTGKAPLYGWFDSVSLYGGQGADLNLREYPGAILHWDFNSESTYFVGGGLGKTQGTLGHAFRVLRGTPLENVQHGYELVVLKHHGLQDQWEFGAAYQLRTPNLEVGGLRVNASAGVGFSHAFGRPTYEDGPAADPTARYRTQLLVLLEAEWGLVSAPHWSLITRIHHRSGAYGAVAPRFVGSNFSVIGVRYRF
jgi:hypothetical protein